MRRVPQGLAARPAPNMPFTPAPSREYLPNKGYQTNQQGHQTYVAQLSSQCYAATQLAPQVQQERTQVVCSNKVARKRLAYSRNGPWNEWQTHTHPVEKKRNRMKTHQEDTENE